MSIVDRPHVSPWLLWNAEHQAELARQIEEKIFQWSRRVWIEHRAYILSSVVASAAFAEAFINEIYQDVEDRGLGLMQPADWLDQVTRSLPEETQLKMRGYWLGTRGGRANTVEKYDRLVEWCGGQLESYLKSDGRLMMRLRNAILHFRPRDHFTVEEAHQLERELITKRGIGENPLAEGGKDRAYWPERSLGSQLADWCVRTATRLADKTCEAAGIDPAYAKYKRGGWFDAPPGTRAVCP